MKMLMVSEEWSFTLHKSQLYRVDTFLISLETFHALVGIDQEVTNAIDLLSPPANKHVSVVENFPFKLKHWIVKKSFMWPQKTHSR